MRLSLADVEVGANTTIDRGAIEDTIIEEGVKLDNLIMIAHNVRIGAHTAIAACSGISGSASIGKRCMIGGMVGIAGHIGVADDVVRDVQPIADAEGGRRILPVMPPPQGISAPVALSNPKGALPAGA